MIEREPSRLEQILAKYGQRWQIERDGLVWTATEHPSPTALHVIIAHDLDALEQKIIDSELPAEQRPGFSCPRDAPEGP
jgi:hypothetical protein